MKGNTSKQKNITSKTSVENKNNPFSKVCQNLFQVTLIFMSILIVMVYYYHIKLYMHYADIENSSSFLSGLIKGLNAFKNIIAIPSHLNKSFLGINLCLFISLLFLIYFFLKSKSANINFVKSKYLLPSITIIFMIVANLAGNYYIIFWSKMSEFSNGNFTSLDRMLRKVLSSTGKSVEALIYYLLIIVISYLIGLILTIISVIKLRKKD